MDVLALLALCFVAGLFLQRSPAFPKEAHKVLNGYVIWVSLPALVLVHIPKVQLEADLLLPVLTPWLVACMAVCLFAGLARFFGWSRATWVTLVLTGGLGNTSFLGLPMVEALIGAEGLGLALLIDQLGTFLALYTVGLPLAGWASGQATSWGSVVRSVVLFPPTVALFLALLLHPFMVFPSWLDGALLRIGASLAPVALVAVGLQLQIGEIMREKLTLFVGLFYKLLLAPFLIYLFLMGIQVQDPLVVAVTTLENAMAPMITGSIVAVQFGLNARLASLMVGVGIPLSFLTVHLFVG